MPHSTLEVAFPWGERKVCAVLSEDGWTREAVFECGCCHQGIQQSEGSCVLIPISYWLVLAQREREDAEGRSLVCVSEAGMRLPV